MNVRVGSIVVLMTWLVGCGSTTVSPDAGPGAGGSTGQSGSSGGGARGGATGNAGRGGGAGGTAGTGSGGAGGNPCLSATVGGTCGDEGRSCGNCNDVCNFCSLTVCNGGRWARVEVAPAPCFDCGASLRCQISEQYCVATLPGVPTGVTSYSCVTAPDTCGTTPTCACLQIGGGTCQMSGTGQLTVTLAAP
jgi:hypothetical protein